MNTVWHGVGKWKVLRATAVLGFVANMSGNSYIWFSDKGCCQQSILLIENCEKWILNFS